MEPTETRSDIYFRTLAINCLQGSRLCMSMMYKHHNKYGLFRRVLLAGDGYIQVQEIKCNFCCSISMSLCMLDCRLQQVIMMK